MSAPAQRLISLDVLRGLTVIGMILVNATAGMYYGLEAKVFPLLLHAHWDGLKIADVVFPAFLLMVGVSIPMALGKAKETTGLNADQGRKIFWRTFRLFLIGFLLSNLSWLATFAEPWRFWGVLQRIALVYGACAVLFFLLSPKVRLWLIAAILILYWPLALIPSLDGLSTDLWARGHNFIASVDRIMFGAGGHNYVKGPEGYDPEGLLGTLPAIAQGLIGMTVGEYLLKNKTGKTALTLLGAGIVMLLVGIAWGFVFPVIKDIWSSSFVLVTSGITLIALAGLHGWLDKGKPVSGLANVPVTFALAFGVNAIAAYVLHFLMNSLMGWKLLTQTYFLSRDHVGEAVAALFPVFLFILAVWLPVEYLRRKKWFIKV
ncbi:MAG: hypothetical protein QM645_05705 [Asticcacaulis sp.]